MKNKKTLKELVRKRRLKQKIKNGGIKMFNYTFTDEEFDKITQITETKAETKIDEEKYNDIDPKTLKAEEKIEDKINALKEIKRDCENNLDIKKLIEVNSQLKALQCTMGDKNN